MLWVCCREGTCYWDCLFFRLSGLLLLLSWILKKALSLLVSSASGSLELSNT